MKAPPTIERHGTGMRVYLDDCVVVYSYDTPIGFKFSRMDWVVSENRWGVTTGKDINRLEPQKNRRVSNAVFLAIWADATEGILRDMMFSDDPATDQVIAQRVEELKKGE